MTFLKVVVSIACMVFLVIFLNNLMARIFPQKARSADYVSSYDTCNKQYPDHYTTTSPNYKSDQTGYDKCYKSENQKTADNEAVASMNAWIRAIVVMVILIVIAIFLFKKFPFFSSSLIAGGLFFALSYSIYGMIGNYTSGDLSSSVKQMTENFKLFTSLIAFIALTCADILFFEKDHKNQIQQNSTHSNLS
ncbi:hypothetical protein COT78_01725 [Candidatus Berkelbacteria bacterium CG10_big_fil_rev_8_21_14_0_10_43_13]|uniref:Uncharacterized protein n=1 Tax=Candidatus Berkelbacteria bacterium CG10_big_fil_rev_8_21_14_0_10_43_13 TaxID=1974514 RepID=A0A2H0W6U5_9BACT|nr:MAG: hypothetical protein COT78_01725 [Candidatus Berkelbacteria bacterium CG10_big_fil_rev_8_21_14_0_10_43_13]